MMACLQQNPTRWPSHGSANQAQQLDRPRPAPRTRRERHDARPGGRREGLGDAEDPAAAPAQPLPLVAAEAHVDALRHVARQLDVLLLVLACAAGPASRRRPCPALTGTKRYSAGGAV